MIAFLLPGCQAVLSGALLFAAYAKARQPDVLAAVLRAGRLPAVVIRLLILLLPALEAGLALAVLTSPPALLPWTMGIVTGMLLLVTVWGMWVCVRRLSLACSCPSTGKRGRWSVALTCNAGLALLSGVGTTLSFWTPGVSPGLPAWGMALVAIGGAALIALVMHVRTATQETSDYQQAPCGMAPVGRLHTPARRRLLQFFAAAGGAILALPLLRSAPVLGDGGSNVVAQRMPAPTTAPTDTLNGCISPPRPEEGGSDSGQYSRCSVQVCYCTSCFEVYDSIDKSWVSVARYVCYDSCDGTTVCSTPTWSYRGRVCRQLGCP